MDRMCGRKTMNMGFHDCHDLQYMYFDNIVERGPRRTFVFLVRFNTFPDLMIRSKSKLPF